jgi:hypothetical protein
MVTFIIEASHLFRSGDKFQTQFFVVDVVNYLKRNFYDNTDDFHTVVLHGSTKDEQAERYTAALERFNVTVIRMRPIASIAGENKVYYKPTWYLHKMMGKEIPKGSDLMMVGFHNPRYLTFLQKYTKDYTFSMAAFTTPSKKQGWMQIPEEFNSYLKHSVNLDEHVAEIKAEFKKKHTKTE